MYIVIWRYRIHPQYQSEFEAAYGSRGEWVDIFKHQNGYIRTELLRDANADEYMTIDYWKDAQAYTSFKHGELANYNELDQRCEKFTYGETFVGAFSLERSDAYW